MQQDSKYKNPYSATLISSKNLIFRGAPGTGKSYLAKQIAADIISNGETDDYTSLTDEQKEQMEFVQFHPGYDYSDFVEGLRPKINADGSMGFELQDGIFKKFVARAIKSYENYQKSQGTIGKNNSVHDAMEKFLNSVKSGVKTFKIKNGNEFIIEKVDYRYIYVKIPKNAPPRNVLKLKRYEIEKLLESDTKFIYIKDITKFFNKNNALQEYSYYKAIYDAINEFLANDAHRNATSNVTVNDDNLKKYIFIIDEINRGEISKIFGELFFAIDPGYRGRAGEISTQFSNMHSDDGDKFYIPENVYIIGTMNDIDRSVDTFDFAMRRRFRFVEIKADEHLEMLSSLGDKDLEEEAIRRMIALNDEIASVEDLNVNYQIGASYFLKLKTLDFDQLWTDYLEPLLQEYIRGLHNEEEIMKRFADAYYLMPAKDI
ncbi:MAG: AAA family ATPase [Methanomicrobium sp.]|nr:AAA family ATPase [Methanomicrobium sp.]